MESFQTMLKLNSVYNSAKQLTKSAGWNLEQFEQHEK